MKILTNYLQALVFVKEVPKFWGEKLPIRLYYAVIKISTETRYEWFTGIPKEMVEPLALLLETTLFWGEKHVAEDENFWVYRLGVFSPSTEIPEKELEKRLNFKAKMAQRCLATTKKLAGVQ